MLFNDSQQKNISPILAYASSQQVEKKRSEREGRTQIIVLPHVRSPLPSFPVLVVIALQYVAWWLHEFPRRERETLEAVQWMNSPVKEALDPYLTFLRIILS